MTVMNITTLAVTDGNVIDLNLDIGFKGRMPDSIMVVALPEVSAAQKYVVVRPNL